MLQLERDSLSISYSIVYYNSIMDVQDMRGPTIELRM
jgi:hypothetical protein